MAYTVEHIKTLAGLDKVLVTADTSEDIPTPAKSWAVGSTCEVLEDGGSKYRLSNSGEWVEVDFETGGGGVTEEYVQQKIAEAQLSGGEVDLSAYPARSEVQDMIEPVSNAATAAQSAAAENAEAITTVSEAVSGMSRTLTARTEAEVREALQFAADHPGSYLNLTLAAGLNATVPTLYFRNCVINIYGTFVNDEISNTVTFEKTGTTSNLHLQNSMLYTQKIRYIGNTTGSTRGIGVIRGETGSAIFANNLEFGQAEGSDNFGNNIEVQNGATVYAENCKFRAMSTHSVAAVVFCIAGARATVKNCTIAEDSTVQRLGNAENGGFINQLGTTLDVSITAGGMYALNGTLQHQTAASEDGS